MLRRRAPTRPRPRRCDPPRGKPTPHPSSEGRRRPMTRRRGVMDRPRHTPAATAARKPVHGTPNGTRDATAAVVESYRRLADVFHEVLSEQTLDELLERV